MTAHVVFTLESTLDQGELYVYPKEAQTNVADHEVKILAFYGSHEDLEGTPTEGTVILQFPSMAAAKARYDSRSLALCGHREMEFSTRYDCDDCGALAAAAQNLKRLVRHLAQKQSPDLSTL